MEQTRIISTTAGDIMARLVVHKDFTESNGAWRLFWEDVNQPGCGFHDESTVTGAPFFKTMRAAIAKGVRKYGITAIRAGWPFD